MYRMCAFTLVISCFIAGNYCTFNKGHKDPESNTLLGLKVLYPRDIAFSYKIIRAYFGDLTWKFFNRVQLVPSDPISACGKIYNGDLMHGQVAFIRRGWCTFVSKVTNVQQYGAVAVAVVIYDNDPNESTSWIHMAGDDTEETLQIGIPVFSMLGKDGRMIDDSLFWHRLLSTTVNLPVNYTSTAICREPPRDFC